MCIIVDPPLFIPMLKSSDPSNAIYSPVREWIDNGPGKFVIGGTKYRDELRKICSVLPILAEYERKGKIVRQNNTAVDAEVTAVKTIEPRKDFDDPHLVALVRSCGCKLICVNDPRSHKFLRDVRFYQSNKHRPKLYTRPKNVTLLVNNNIASCCR